MSLGSAFSFAVGTAVDIFYRRRVVPGQTRVPSSGPVLLVANHPNALLDPIVVQNAIGPRRLRALAKAPLFKMPVISTLLKSLQSIPIYRAADGADTRQNTEAFRAVEEALVGGSAVLIFPEGISHDEPSVQPLKTGAARMALAAFAQGARDIVVVPVGLSYADKLRFRSTAAVEIGNPIRVADFAPGPEADEQAGRAAVKNLTAAIYEGLLGVTVNLQHWEDLPILEAVDAIWRQEDPERTRRLKNLAEGTALLREQDPSQFDDMRARLSDWMLRLRRLGVRPQDVAEGAVQARKDPRKLALFALRNFFAAMVGLPFALWGALFWSIPFWTVHFLWMLWRAERDVGASIKVLTAMLIFPLYYALALGVLSRYLSPGLVMGVALVSPVAGMMTRHFFRRRFFAAQQVSTLLRLGYRGQLLADLVRERDAFCQEFDQIATRVEALRAREN